MSSKYEVPYGSSTITFEFEPNENPEIITPKKTHPPHDPLKVVKTALEKPVGLQKLPNLKHKTISVAINDKTRPVPYLYLLPPLLEKLEEMGASRDNIGLIIASGTHTPMTPPEVKKLLPHGIISAFKVTVHNCDDKNNLVYLGETSRRTPIWLNRDYANADIKIVTGNIEPHHFMGFSGGVKGAAIGLTGRDTININHAFLLDDKSALGVYDENPMRQDVEEIGKRIGVNFALNTILDEEKNIIYAISGDPFEVMKEGVRLSRKVCQVPVMKLFDLVIASVGGSPKDINLYQSQKALSRASLLTRDGGVVILVAECPEGSGSSGYEAFMQNIDSPQAVFEKFETIGFEVGPHKALQFAKDQQRLKVILLSKMPPSLVKNLLLIPAKTPEEALSCARSFLPSNPSIAILPFSKNILPTFQS